MKKTIALISFLFIAQISFAQDIKVGILFDQFANRRWKIDKEALIAEFTKLDVEIIVKVAHSNFDLQMTQGFELIDEQVDAIVIIAVDGTRPHSFFSKANENDIKIIAYDRPIFDENIDLYVSYDNVEIGRIQASSILNNIDSGNIILVNGPDTDINAVKFREGQLEALKPHIESGKINILHDIILDSWDEAIALLAMYEHEFDFSNVQGLLFALDTFVQAAIEYQGDTELFKNIYITGQDPSTATLSRLKNDIQNMSILKPIQPLAKKTVELTLSKIKEEAHPDIEIVHFDENNSVDGYLFHPIVLDKTNTDDNRKFLYEN